MQLPQSGESNKLKLFLWATTLFLGLCQSWIGRYSMNPDGIVYLNMGEAYFRGDWKMAINTLWSPLYSWIITIGFHVFDPSLYWKFPVVHFMQFLIFIAAMASFHFFLMQVIQWNRTKDREGSSKYLNFPDWSWLILGYTIFGWSSLKLITVTRETPDMTAVIFLFLAAAITLRIRSGQTSFRNFLLLGSVLAFGYLTRASFFYLAFVFLALTFFSIKNRRNAISRSLAALLVFFCISGPYIYALSKSKGRLTTGESGKINYGWKVNNIPKYVHWQGTPGFGKPKHPTRKIFENPAIYEFGSPIGGTYPPWYDAIYWHDGMEVRFILKQQLARIVTSIRVFLDVIFRTQDDFGAFNIFGADALAIGYIVLLLMSNRRFSAFRDLSHEYALLIPSFVGLALYAFVSVLPRYVGGFFVLFYIGIFCSIRMYDSQENRRLWQATCTAVCLVMFLGIFPSLLQQTYSDFRDTMKGRKTFEQGKVAEGLLNAGVLPGTKVGYIGYALEAYWAYLGQLKLVAEIPLSDANQFWSASPDLRTRVYKKFAETEATVIVTSNPPPWAPQDGWIAISNTNHFYYSLSRFK